MTYSFYRYSRDHPCVVCNTRKSKHPHLLYHSFPTNKERCKQWINAINMKHLHNKSTKYLSTCGRVCSIHFSTESYIYPESSRLRKDACPDQNLTEIDTGESKIITEAQETPPNKDGGKDIDEKQGNSSSEQGKSPNEEVESTKQSVGKRSPTKNEASLLSDTTGDLPPPKRKKTLDKQGEINFIDLSGNDDDYDDSSSVDPLWVETENKTSCVEKRKPFATSGVQGGRKIKTYPSKSTGPPLINEKTVAKGGNEDEINVLSSHKGGTNQTIATYRAVVPKGKSSILNKLAFASVSSLPTVRNANPLSPSSVSSLTTTNSSGKVVVPSNGVEIPIPPVTLANGKTSSVQQALTSPICVKTPVTSNAGKQPNKNVVILPLKNLQQLQNMQKKTSDESSATSVKPICDTNLSPVDISNDNEEEAIVKQKEGAEYSVPTGKFKVLKSVTMYKLTDMNNLTGFSAAGNTSVRWVAIPKIPGESKSLGGAPVSSCTVPVSFSTSGYKGSSGDEVISEKLYTNKIQHLRAKQKEQLNYLRKRYSDLLHSYNKLANKYNEVRDVGTMKQILTDAKKYMRKDHILFFKNEMNLHDRNNRGLRYSPKFMMLLMKYYKRSYIGYRFLKGIFTLPEVRTLLKWRNKNLPLKKKKSASSGTMNSLLSAQHSDATVKSKGGDSESCSDSDREAEDSEENSIEVNPKE